MTLPRCNAPLAIDLYAGLGGWSEGLLAEGFNVIGFDIERHQYGDARYPAQLVLQDVLTLHGRQFREASLILASPPCQFFSYCAMPWSKAKKLSAEVRASPERTAQATALFDACFRIQREASEAAGHHIPLIVENVRGAQKWVGRSRWNYGSFHLWGDVPALMPMTMKGIKVGGIDFNGYGTPNYKAVAFNGTAAKRLREEGVKMPDGASMRRDDRKNNGGSWFNIGSPGQKETNRNPVHEGVKGFTPNGEPLGKHGSKSTARKAASAQIAKIPFPLARYIAATFKPQ